MIDFSRLNALAPPGLGNPNGFANAPQPQVPGMMQTMGAPAQMPGNTPRGPNRQPSNIPGLMQTMLGQGAAGIMDGINGFRDARQEWRADRPMHTPGMDMGEYQTARQEWRDDRPMFMDYWGQGGLNPLHPQAPAAPQAPQMPPQMAPQPPQMPIPLPAQVGAQLGVLGMQQAQIPFGLPTYGG